MVLGGLLVEDRDTTQWTGFPFTEVPFECRVERVEKCAHDGDFKPWTCNALFVALIFDYGGDVSSDMRRCVGTLIIDDNGEECCDDKGPPTDISEYGSHGRQDRVCG
jgi:hypothetical protein